MIKDAGKIKTAVCRAILSWYDQEKRILPWRESTNPYRIWVSEIMLQQTQVDTVIPYYERFLEAFPTVFALAAAPLQDVLMVWQNLGYYSRARHLHAAAGLVVTRFGGDIPNTWEGLRALPGIGDYTAGAILSMAFGRAVPAVDGNIRRIMARLFAFRDPVDEGPAQKKLAALTAALVPGDRPGDFNQALMDLGSAICKAKAPQCTLCPLVAHCLAASRALQDVLPLSKKRPAIPHRQGTAAFIRDGKGCILLVQRPATGLLGSLWKLPGGLVPEAEEPKVTLTRIVREELGVEIQVGPLLASADHAYTHFRLTLHAYEARIIQGSLVALACQDRQWVSPADLHTIPLSKVDRMIMHSILYL
jgi:A/G-specific adenine glycosylase